MPGHRDSTLTKATIHGYVFETMAYMIYRYNIIQMRSTTYKQSFTEQNTHTHTTRNTETDIHNNDHKINTFKRLKTKRNIHLIVLMSS